MFQSDVSKGCCLHCEDTTHLLPLEAVLHLSTPFPEISPKTPLCLGTKGPKELKHPPNILAYSKVPLIEVTADENFYRLRKVGEKMQFILHNTRNVQILLKQRAFFLFSLFVLFLLARKCLPVLLLNFSAFVI